MPLAAAWAPVARWLGFPAESFAPGAQYQPPLRAGGHEVAVSICYEITFGAEIARALGNAALLVNVSNDAWFGDTAGPHQHFQMARMRALELGRWMVRATNTGISALVTPKARVAASLPPFEAGAMEVAPDAPSRAAPPMRSGATGRCSALAALLLVIGWRVGRRPLRPGRAHPRP